jgi:hypothetical protein
MTRPEGNTRALRLNLDADQLGRGLGRLVVALLEVVRELLERQALRRVDAASLSAEQTERLGRALLALEDGIAEMREIFGVREADIALPLNVVDLDGRDDTNTGGDENGNDHAGYGDPRFTTDDVR